MDTFAKYSQMMRMAQPRNVCLFTRRSESTPWFWNNSCRNRKKRIGHGVTLLCVYGNRFCRCFVFFTGVRLHHFTPLGLKETCHLTTKSQDLVTRGSRCTVFTRIAPVDLRWREAATWLRIGKNIFFLRHSAHSDELRKSFSGANCACWRPEICPRSLLCFEHAVKWGLVA